MIRFSRRRLLAAAAAVGALLPRLHARAAGAALDPTPAMTEGPFYPEQWPATPRASLIVGPLRAGVPLALSGSVRDARGAPLAGVRVEIWQCDGLGRYRHSRDRGGEGVDPAFLGFGWGLSDASGQWAFETIRPVPYPGRTPHIHLSAIAPQGRRLITQIFIDGEPGNANDGLWRWLPEAARRRVTIPLRAASAAASAAPAPEPAAAAADVARATRLEGRFDVVLRA
ncbi:MAG: intradiol ring-cleavage dioxygenase [Burkholderiaceae bacterium]